MRAIESLCKKGRAASFWDERRNHECVLDVLPSRQILVSQINQLRDIKMLEIKPKIDDKVGNRIMGQDRANGIGYAGLIEGRVETDGKIEFDCKFLINNDFIKQKVTIDG